MAATTTPTTTSFWDGFSLDSVLNIGAKAIEGYSSVNTIKAKAAADQAAADAVLKSREYDLQQQALQMQVDTPAAAISLSNLTLTPTYIAFAGAAIVAAYFAFKK